MASLGFGRVVTLIDVVLVARHGGGHCGCRNEICIFRRKVDFVIEEAMEDLGDEEALVLDLGIPAGTITHKDTNTCLSKFHPRGPLTRHTFIGRRKSTKDGVRAGIHAQS